MTPQHPSCYHVSYSLSCDDYDDLLRIANGQCQVCEKANPRPFIEHDHALGQWAVRGLVCHVCNQRLRHVDAGDKPATPAIARYLASPWHERQASSAAKRARMKPRVNCPTCGYEVGLCRNGKLVRHWNRLPGQIHTICPGAQLPKRPGDAS